MSLPALTPRQSEIVHLLKERNSNKAIGRRLGISHYTVRNHITLLRRILDVQKRHEIVPRALALGLIEAASPIDDGPPHG